MNLPQGIIAMEKYDWIDEECGKPSNTVVNERYSLFPIKDPEVWALYKQAKACFWVAEEGDLSQDAKDFKERLTEPQKRFVLKVLAFFNGADVIVNKNISANFLEDFNDNLEIQCFYYFQGMMENIHSESYSLMIDTLARDDTEKDLLLNAISYIPSVGKKAEWVNTYMNKNIPLVKRLFGFTLVEGLQFSGSFCAIFWLKTKGLMPGLAQYNELISRDEGLHCKFSALMFKRENAKLSDEKKMTQKEAYNIVEDCVDIEKLFVNDCLKIDLIGMNRRLMSEYIEFVADVMLVLCGFDKLYNTNNPFVWMESISLEGKTNFFEKRVSEYQKAGVGAKKEEQVFSINEDF